MAIRSLYIGIGSNLGDRLQQIISAKSHISNVFNTPIKCSSIYETEPWGFKEQEHFLNQVLSLETDLNPMEIWDLLSMIETNMGRIRHLKFGPRNIDLDILLLNSLYFKNKHITIPHPQMHQRRFVLIPLLELEPDFIHPLFLKKTRELFNECTDSSQTTKYQYYESQS